MKPIKIEEINFDRDYEGYIWYSDQSRPQIHNNISKNFFTELPFIIEGNFYNAKEQISISIKNIDGQYLIHQVELSNLPKEQITENKYLAHKLDGIKEIKTIQFWEESEADNLLEGMKTLKPSWQAFIGFIKK